MTQFYVYSLNLCFIYFIYPINYLKAFTVTYLIIDISEIQMKYLDFDRWLQNKKYNHKEWIKEK
jgi:hypothetical protein